MLIGFRQKLGILPDTLEHTSTNLAKKIATGAEAMKEIKRPLFYDRHFSAYAMLFFSLNFDYCKFNLG